jgi:hypothetical protein
MTAMSEMSSALGLDARRGKRLALLFNIERQRCHMKATLSPLMSNRGFKEALCIGMRCWH